MTSVVKELLQPITPAGELHAQELRERIDDLNMQARLRATVAEHGAGVLQHLTPAELDCYNRSMQWACIGDISQAVQRAAAEAGFTHSGVAR